MKWFRKKLSANELDINADQLYNVTWYNADRSYTDTGKMNGQDLRGHLAYAEKHKFTGIFYHNSTDGSDAFARNMSLVSGIKWEPCCLLEKHILEEDKNEMDISKR